MDFNFTDTIIREEWDSIYERNTSITNYGKRSPTEDFAEYYTIMMGYEYDSDQHRQINGSRIKEKDEIIETLLKEYPTFDLRR